MTGLTSLTQPLGRAPVRYDMFQYVTAEAAFMGADLVSLIFCNYFYTSPSS